MEKVFQYKGIGSAPGGVISAQEIMNMPMPEFYIFRDRLMNVTRRKRRDIAIYKNNIAVTPEHRKQIFRKGIGEEDTYANVNTEFIKTRAHTNMNRGGNFGEGNLTIICGIEAYFNCTAGQATATEHGIITNPKAVTVANYDPFLLAAAWLSQVELFLIREETERASGLLEEFPQKTGLSGVAGASPGAIAQNAFLPSNPMASPEVLFDDEDFHILIQPLASSFDLTAATGLDITIVQEVKLETIELRRKL